MGKLLVISVIFAIVAIPIAAAREPNPLRGVRKAVLYTLVFNGAYVLALRFVLPRLGL
ncbi:MAG: hypothetical protein ACJ79Y_14585 [Myxococcales bacterium]